MPELTQNQKEDIKTVFNLIEEQLDKYNQFNLSLLKDSHSCGTTACFIGWNSYLICEDITDIIVEEILRAASEEYIYLFKDLCYNAYDDKCTLPYFPRVSKVEDVTFDYFKEVFYEKFGIEG